MAKALSVYTSLLHILKEAAKNSRFPQFME